MAGYRKQNMVKIYFNILKPKDQYENVRAYYISNYIGEPFMKFDIGGGTDWEKMEIAKHLGIKVEQLEIVKRGKQ